METVDGVVLNTIRRAYLSTWFVTKRERIVDGRDIFDAYCYNDFGNLVCLIAGVDFDAAQTAVDLDMVGLYDSSRG